MAIGDRLKRAVRNRREKAGEVTGKKRYSVMGKAGGRATGTKWVRGKKKKAEKEKLKLTKKVKEPARIEAPITEASIEESARHLDIEF